MDLPCHGLAVHDLRELRSPGVDLAARIGDGSFARNRTRTWSTRFRENGARLTWPAERHTQVSVATTDLRLVLQSGERVTWLSTRLTLQTRPAKSLGNVHVSRSMAVSIGQRTTTR